MPTNNPKVSAYIPQHIFDCFKAFYEERSISMSQAVAIIFAEYFAVDYQVDQASKLPSGQILSKLQVLEEKVNIFSNLPNEPISELLSRVNFLSEMVVSLKSRLDAMDQSSLSNQKEPINPEKLDILDNSQTELFSELLSGLNIKPLSTKLLASRLGVHSATISHTKAKLSRDDFCVWLKSKDPDDISWIDVSASNERASKGYFPDISTPSELLSKLQIWLEQKQSQS
jgi:hypothetical protein